MRDMTAQENKMADIIDINKSTQKKERV